MSDRQTRKGQRRSLSLWSPPVPERAFGDKAARAQRVPSPEEVARNDEQAKRLEAALIRTTA